MALQSDLRVSMVTTPALYTSPTKFILGAKSWLPYCTRIADRITLYVPLLDGYLTPRIMLSASASLTHHSDSTYPCHHCSHVGSAYSHTSLVRFLLFHTTAPAIPHPVTMTAGVIQALNHTRFGEKMALKPQWSAVVQSILLTLLILTQWTRVSALDWVPTDEEMAKYRQSWNPPTHGHKPYFKRGCSSPRAVVRAGICAGNDRVRRISYHCAVEECRRSVQPGYRHAGRHFVLRAHPPCAGRSRCLRCLLAFRYA